MKECTYCLKRFPVIELRMLPDNDPRTNYCSKCYPEVLAAYKKLPWNREYGKHLKFIKKTANLLLKE